MSRGTAHAAHDALILGRYRPLRPLGAGGSGSVWLARDERSGVEVALKIVRRDGKAGERAEREAAAATRLRHRRCPRAYTLARDGDHVYIAYEYVRGRTWRDAVRAGDLTDKDAVEAGAQVLDALAHAHARGIVHRDVKPANVLLEDGDEVSVRLLDFGLATIEDADPLTALGDVPGTLAYIAPERLHGDAATAASDVWSVGVALWEALAGEHPFWRPSVVESARAIEAGAPPLAAARPDLPPRLQQAVDRALSHDPARRPSAAKLAKELRGTAAGRRRTRDAGEDRTGVVALSTRMAPALLAALVSGAVTVALPFFPTGFAPALAAACAALTYLRPRAGLALTLATPVLPLGNVSLGLAVLYGLFAAVWFAGFAREARYGLLPAVGPLLGPLAALALVPMLVQQLRSPLRRAAAAAAAVLLAALTAALRGEAAPFTGGTIPTVALHAAESPLQVADVLADALAAQPDVMLAAVALGLAAAVLPLAVARGPYAIGAFGAALIAGLLLPTDAVRPASVVVGVWLACGALWAWEIRRRSVVTLGRAGSSRPLE